MIPRQQSWSLGICPRNTRNTRKILWLAVRVTSCRAGDRHSPRFAILRMNRSQTGKADGREAGGGTRKEPTAEKGSLSNRWRLPRHLQALCRSGFACREEGFVCFVYFVGKFQSKLKI